MTRRQLATEVAWELLTDQQRAFSEEWVRTHNFQKALDAGKYDYSTNKPSRLAKRLLRRCKRYVDYLETRALQSSWVSVDAMRMRLAVLGHANLIDYYIIDPDDGNLRPKAIHELTREEAYAVKSWTTVPYKKRRADGTEYDIWVLHDIELEGKRGPVQDLLKSLGGMPTGAPGSPPPTPPEPGGIDFAKLPPEKVRQIDAAFKQVRQLLSNARDAQAISESRGADGGQAERAGQPVGRLLPPPATKG